MRPNSSHFTEDELVQIALDTGEGKDPVNHIVEHLRACPLCSERLEFFLTLYRNLAVELGQRKMATTSPVQGLSGTRRVIEFSRFETSWHPDSGDPTSAPLVLAAKGVPKKSNRFMTVAVFSSAAPAIVLRILHEAGVSEYKAAFILEEPAVRMSIMIKINDQSGLSTSVVMPDGGVAAFTVPTGFDWTHAHITAEVSIH